MPWIGLLALGACLLTGTEEAERYLRDFPAAEEGMVRHVLLLPEQEDEANYQVELIVGKTVEVDPVNHFGFSGTIEKKTLDGFGFDMYVVPELGEMFGTLIGVDPNEPDVPRFITLGGEPLLVRYNSRLPIVIYVPQGAEVRYRIWQATPEAKTMQPG